MARAYVHEKPFLAPPDALTDLFSLRYPLQECIERTNALGVMAQLRRDGDVPKMSVKITENLSAFIQNIVLTMVIEDVAPAEDFTATITRMSLLDDSEAATPPPKHPHHINMDRLVEALRFHGAQYNRKRFGSVILRSNVLDAAALIFATGKIVSTGCPRIELSLAHVHDIVATLQAVLPRPFHACTPVLCNIVSSGVFPNCICTDYMVSYYSRWCSHVGRFPGVMISNQEKLGDRVVLIFTSGRYCHSGAQSPQQVYDDMKFVYPILLACQATPERIKVNDRIRAHAA